MQEKSLNMAIKLKYLCCNNCGKKMKFTSVHLDEFPFHYVYTCANIHCSSYNKYVPIEGNYPRYVFVDENGNELFEKALRKVDIKNTKSPFIKEMFNL